MKFNILPMEFTLLFLQLLIIEASGCHYSSIKEDFSAHRRQQNRANYVPEPEEEEKIEVHNEPDKTELHLLELHGGTAKIFTVVMAIGCPAVEFKQMEFCLVWLVVDFDLLFFLGLGHIVRAVLLLSLIHI